MGFHSNPATAFLMTIFNVRLGWWLANPRVLAEDGGKLGRPKGRLFDPYPKPSPHFSLFQLLNELLGLKIKIVLGYPGQSESYLAMERGELDSVGLTFWSSLTSTPRAKPKSQA